MKTVTHRICESLAAHGLPVNRNSTGEKARITRRYLAKIGLSDPRLEHDPDGWRRKIKPVLKKLMAGDSVRTVLLDGTVIKVRAGHAG